MQKNILVFSLLMLFLSSCVGNKLEKYLEEINTHYPYLDSGYNWEVIHHYNIKKHDEFYHIQSIKKDTLIEMMFSKFHAFPKISNLKVMKSFRKNDTCHRIIIKNKDTLIYFLSKGNCLDKFDIRKDKIFLFKKGSYKQQYENGLMTEHQRSFYRVNKDSLNLIEERNLKSLPEIKK